MQLILYIVNPINVLNSLVQQRFDGDMRVFSILIVSCHSQMIVILLLHIQFEYFLFFLADLHSVVLQLHSDQEWQEKALLFFTQPYKENFQLFTVFQYDVSHRFTL